MTPQLEDVPKPEVTDVKIAPISEEERKPEIARRRPTADWEAPEDFEIVFEKLEEEKPEPEVTTIEVTKVVKEEGTCITPFVPCSMYLVIC